MAFIVVIVLIVLVVVFVIQRYRKNSKKWGYLKKIPGPRPQLILGNVGWVLDLYRRKMALHPGVYILERMQGFCHLYKNYGTYIFYIGSEAVLSIFTAELTEVVLSSSTILEKSMEYSLLHRWLGTGLLTSTGEKWKSRRKLLTPCFHFRILEDFLPTFNDQSRILVRKLQSLSQQDSVDVIPLVVLCTLDIVCETVMGAHIRAQEGGNLEYVKAVHNLGDFFNQRNIRPWLYSDFVFGLTKLGRGFDKDLKTLQNFTQKVIHEKKALLSRNKVSDKNISKEDEESSLTKTKKRQALMDLLLDLHVNGEQLTVEDIQEEVDTFMFEGHDTTASGITFALYCIGLYPEIQEKIHEEIESIFLGNEERDVSMDDARSLKYLECVLKESQRIYPSVPLIGRKMSEDVKYKDYVIPKGTTAHINIFCLHRNSNVYPEPEIFNPERFSPENSAGRHPYAFVPFSAGPRNCIGQKFALLEEKVVICNILRRFRIVSLDERDKLHQKIEFVLRPAEAVRIKFYPRS